MLMSVKRDEKKWREEKSDVEEKIKVMSQHAHLGDRLSVSPFPQGRFSRSLVRARVALQGVLLSTSPLPLCLFQVP